jgi:hypothetical protein
MAKRNPAWLVSAAIFVFACGLAGLVHHVKLAATVTETADRMSAFVPGLMYLMVGTALAILMTRHPTSPPRPAELAPAPLDADSTAGTLAAIAELTQAVTDLRATIAEQFAPARQQEVVTNSATPGAESMTRVIELLDEIRELSMMSDAQRKARFLHHSNRRKTLLLRQARNCIGASEFAEAERILEQCTASYGHGDDVTDVARQLADARAITANAAVDEAASQAADLMALSRWDEAMAMADALVGNHPTHEAAQTLRDRVARERDVFRNAACQRLYDEIRSDVDHRDWRKALAGTQKLLEKYGDLPRADKVRATLRTIQDNAEIQERQEFEARIQELIRAHRFTDAIELSEELIARFPESPQAEKLRELLPRLREHAVNEEASELVNRQA